RVALASAGKVGRLLDETVCWARSTRMADGRRVIDRPWVQLALARVRAKVDALRLMNYRMAWEMGRDAPNPADASAVKVFGTELYIEAYRLLLEVAGERGFLRDGSPEAVIDGELEFAHRNATVLTFGGGVNEVQRTIIATVGLG